MSSGPDFSTRPQASPRGRFETPVLAASALLLAASLFAAWQAAAERRAAGSGLSELRHEVGVARARVEALEARQRGRGETLAAQLVWTSEAPPTRLLAELTALLPKAVRLENVSFSYGPTLEIDLQLLARQPPAYDLLLERLAESPLFVDVVPGVETREGEMRASLRMRYRPLP